MLKFKRNMGLGFLVVLIAIGSFASYAFAEKDEEWSLARENFEKIDLKNMSEEQRCDAVWNFLWPLAKKGNLEARANLFKYAHPAWPKLPQIIMPGQSDDEISMIKHQIVLGIYSLEFQSDKDVDAFLEENLINIPHGKNFLECIKNNPKESCIKSAYATANLIPDFKDYALEIDALLAAGMKQRCVNFQDTPWIK